MYKICSNRANGYFSYLQFNQYSIEYKIGEWVYPKIGKCLVFDTLDNAKTFLLRENNYGDSFYSIFECVVKNPYYIAVLADIGFISNLDFFWKGVDDILESSQPAPCGTIACDAVKLLRKINYESTTI